MSESLKSYCPECESIATPPEGLHRRQFIRVVSAGAAALAGLSAGGTGLRALADEPAKSAPSKPSEDLVKELYGTFTADQKRDLILPWDHGDKAKGMLTRLGMYNAPIGNKHISDHYTKPQQELLERILRSLCSGEEGYERISRNGTFDSSGSLDGCGAVIFGEPVDGQKFSWVFTGHHLTVRCDGNSEEKTAFGGPIYYGHSPNGYSDRNVFNYQTKSVLSVYEALNEGQRKVAVVTGSPGEQAPSVRLRPADQPKPGVAYAELEKGQRELVEKVMRDVLSPYRKADVDEVMDIIKTTGGMEKIHLAFYKDAKMNDQQPWHFWRLEGPGFVWNYRVLPHVHTFVNISSKVS